MKTTLNLTFEDGVKVVKALRDTAIEHGWDEDELDDAGVIEEYACVIDAALTAMGIEVSISNIPSDEEDEDDEWDEDEDEEDMESIIYDCDGHRGISSADARLLMQCVAKTISKKFSGLPEDILTIFIQTETMRIANVYGIEVVDTSGDE